MKWLISLGLVVANAIAGASIATADEHAAPIKMAVRTDTRPFIWMNSASGEFLGFYWDICTEAIYRAGYQLETVEIGSAERTSILGTGRIGTDSEPPAPAKVASLTGEPPAGTPPSTDVTEIDFLCDPTTITLQRMRSFPVEEGTPVLHFSQIVFVANSSFVKSKPGKDITRNEGKLPEDGPDPPCDCILPWIDHLGAASRGKPAPAHTCQEPWWPEKEAVQAGAAEEGEDSGDEGTPENRQAGFWDRFKIEFQFVPNTPQQVKTEIPKDYEIWGYVEGSTIGDALNALLNKPPKIQIGA